MKCLLAAATAQNAGDEHWCLGYPSMPAEPFVLETVGRRNLHRWAVPGLVRALARSSDGSIWVGGEFDRAGSGGLPVNNIARASPAGTWDILAGGFDGSFVQFNGTTFSSNGVWDIDIGSGGLAGRWGAGLVGEAGFVKGFRFPGTLDKGFDRYRPTVDGR